MVVTSTHSRNPGVIRIQESLSQIEEPSTQSVWPLTPAMRVKRRAQEPDHQVIGQYRSLEKGMICPKFVNRHGAEPHLILSGPYKIFRNRSLVVELFRVQPRQSKVGTQRP